VNGYEPQATGGPLPGTACWIDLPPQVPTAPVVDLSGLPPGKLHFEAEAGVLRSFLRTRSIGLSLELWCRSPRALGAVVLSRLSDRLDVRRLKP
jgi:hypothetical protein